MRVSAGNVPEPSNPFAALVLSSISYHSIADADRVLTRALAALRARTVRRVRIEWTLFTGRLHRRPKKDPRPEVEFSEEIELSADELRTLRLHGELDPGYALGLSEIARALQVRKSRAEAALIRLKSLQLLETTACGVDGEDAYVLTRTGRAFLLFKQLAVRT
jgi:DNA-binding MarR family transcriptional regulator